MPDFIGALDQGTTSTRFMVFDSQARPIAIDQREHRQIFPRPGWVEHDPLEIWENTVAVIEGAFAKAGISPGDLAGVGMTNQRETTVVWDARSGEPVGNAIVWQDTRTSEICRDLSSEGGQDRFRSRTGLPIATYFSGPKARWLIDEHGVREDAERGDLMFGTVDTWLTWHLTGGHVTDSTNASRSLLMDLGTRAWDADLCDAIGVPAAMLPQIVDSIGPIGTCQGPLEGVPLTAILGDQQAALFGQVCFSPGEAKNTYGTGNFMLMNTGPEVVESAAGLISTVAYSGESIETTYALEGSIAVTGSLIQWLRDNLGLISSAAEVEALAAEVEDNGDVYMVPAFSGLFAPHWRDDARGVIVGLTRFANKSHIARAALEATAFQTNDIVNAMTEDSGVELDELRVDGGMTRNGLLMQFQADLLDVDVVRPSVVETTALGAAFAAGVGCGVFESLDHVRDLWTEAERWSPDMSEERRTSLTKRWDSAVERSLDWV